MNDQELAELEALRKENANLKAKATRQPGELTITVGKKGGISVYGLGRFPVTLYASQFTRLLDNGERIRAFITENDAVLAHKAQATA